MAAGGLQMLATSSVCGADAAVRHLLWCFVLQTSMDRAHRRQVDDGQVLPAGIIITTSDKGQY